MADSGILPWGRAKEGEQNEYKVTAATLLYRGSAKISVPSVGPALSEELLAEYDLLSLIYNI